MGEKNMFGVVPDPNYGGIDQQRDEIEGVDWRFHDIDSTLDALTAAEREVEKQESVLFFSLLMRNFDFWSQTVFWRDAGGRVHFLRDMESEHIRNVMRFLMRRARLYKSWEESHLLDWMYLMPHGDGAMDGLESIYRDLEEQKPSEWMRRTELFKAFHQLLVKRRRRGEDVKKPRLTVTVKRVQR